MSEFVSQPAEGVLLYAPPPGADPAGLAEALGLRTASLPRLGTKLVPTDPAETEVTAIGGLGALEQGGQDLAGEVGSSGGGLTITDRRVVGTVLQEASLKGKPEFRWFAIERRVLGGGLVAGDAKRPQVELHGPCVVHAHAQSIFDPGKGRLVKPGKGQVAEALAAWLPSIERR